MSNQLTDRYKLELPYLQDALLSWQEHLTRLAGRIDPNASVDGRVKTLRSLLTKAYKSDRNNPREWERFGDLVGLKVIFPTTAGAAEFTNELERASRESDTLVDLDRRVSEPHVLGYAADQFNLCDPKIPNSLDRGVEVEVQVRTVASDAWYIVDHRIRYKGTLKLSPALERRMLRLTVLMELFDSEVDALTKEVRHLEDASGVGEFVEISRLFNDFVESYAPPARPEGLFETLLKTYPEAEASAVVGRLERLLETRGEQLRGIYARHSSGSDKFVERYDWLYMEPESLMIADLALEKPAKLRHQFQNSDFDDIVDVMAEEFADLNKSA